MDQETVVDTAEQESPSGQRSILEQENDIAQSRPKHAPGQETASGSICQ